MISGVITKTIMLRNTTKLITIRLFFFTAIATLMSSCAIVSRETIPREELHTLVKEHLILFNDDGLKELSDEFCDNQIIFLGEVHRVPALIDTANKLAVCLANDKPVVYADEACYGLSYIWEAASLGEQNQSVNPACIEHFNSGQPKERKILRTAIDVEHTIVTKKPEVAKHLYGLSKRSSSVAARSELDGEIERLTSQKSTKDMSRYLKKLRSRFTHYLDTFSTEDQEEVLFFIELLEASNRFYELTRAQGIGAFWKKSRGWDLREKYFVKTTERAYRKAINRKAILLCRVGSGHITEDKKMLGWHFKHKYKATKDRVVCINMIPLYNESHESTSLHEGKTSIESIAKFLVENKKYGYISLHALQESTNKRLNTGKHFYGKKAKYDGILFVKAPQK